jgi:hypothetical protein
VPRLELTFKFNDRNQIAQIEHTPLERSTPIVTDVIPDYVKTSVNPPTPPASGGTIDIFTAFLPLPPNPVDQNPAWQEVNKQLNATVNFNTVSQADFQAKFATLLAGGDLPDVALVRQSDPQGIPTSSAVIDLVGARS